MPLLFVIAIHKYLSFAIFSKYLGQYKSLYYFFPSLWRKIENAFTFLSIHFLTNILFLIGIVGGGVQIGSTRHCGHL
jgi:hypothetical protein